MTMTTPTTETGIVELLPCPFCGPRPEESGEWPQLFECSSPYLTEFSIRCGRCGIEMGDEYRDPLVAAWNTRAAMPDSTQLLQTMAGAWQPIETFTEPTAPSSGNGVLVADKDGTVGEAYFRNFDDEDDGWWWANTNWGDYPEPERPNNPSHWQPLPEPPAQFRAQEQRS